MSVQPKPSKAKAAAATTDDAPPKRRVNRRRTVKHSKRMGTAIVEPLADGDSKDTFQMTADCRAAFDKLVGVASEELGKPIGDLLAVERRKTCMSAHAEAATLFLFGTGAEGKEAVQYMVERCKQHAESVESEIARKDAAKKQGGAEEDSSFDEDDA